MPEPPASRTLPPLNPSRSDGVAYAAFISYRRESPDIDWAMRLQKWLEAYRTPKRLVRSHHLPARLGRIFLDSEELATSGDLTNEVRTKLSIAEKLIVVCSPRAKASQWVAAECEFFLRHKGRESLILFLIDGTPETSFPECLLQARSEAVSLLIDHASVPLAADPRPTSAYRPRRARLLTFLRVAATILGVEFDLLRERERERRIRRFLALGLATAAVLGIISTFGLVALAQSARAKAGRALAYAASGATSLNDRDYLAAEAIYAGALQLNDAPFIRAQYATAALHAPKVLYKQDLDSHSPVAIPKFFSKRRITYCGADESLILVTQSGKLEKINAETGETISSKQLGGSVWTLTIDGTSTLGVAGSADGRLVAFNPANLATVQETELKQPLRSLAFSSDGETVLAGTESGLYFLDARNLSQSREEPITAHAYNVNAVASVAGLGAIWAAETRVFLTMTGKDQKTDIAFNGNGAILTVAAESGTICFAGEDRTVYLESPNLKHKMVGHRGDIEDIAILANGRLVASLETGGSILIWRTHSGTLLSRFQLGDGTALSICHLKEDAQLAVLTANGLLYRLSVNPNLRPEIISGPVTNGAAVYEHLFSFGGKCVAVSNYGDVVVADAKSRQESPLYRLQAGGVGISHIALSPDGKRWALQGYYSHSWELRYFEKGDEAGTLPFTKTRDIGWLNETELLALGEDGKLYRAAVGGTAIPVDQNVNVAATTISAIAVSPKGTKLAVSRSDGSLSVLDTRSWAELSKHLGSRPASRMAVTEDGVVAAVINAKVYRASAKTRMELIGDGVCVAFSPNGKMLAVGDDQVYAVSIYSVSSRQLICKLLAHESPISAISFTSEQELWTSEFENCVKDWDITAALEFREWRPDQVAESAARETRMRATFADDRLTLEPVRLKSTRGSASASKRFEGPP